MIGEIKEIEVGRVIIYEKETDKKGKITNKIKEEIPGKKYELRKQGVNMALEINSVFIELVMKARNMGDNLTAAQLGAAMAVGMRGQVVEDVQRIIQTCVGVPKLTDEKYNELTPSDVTDLFSEIYHFHISEVEKKSDSTKTPETGQTGEKKPES